MITIQCSVDESARGAGFPLTMEQAAQIANSEPPAERGSAPGLSVFFSPEKPEQKPSEPRQEALF